MRRAFPSSIPPISSISSISSLAVACALAAAACAPARPETTGDSPAAIELRVQPDDGPPALAALIAGARRSIAVEVYLLTEGELIDALVAARAGGREVTVVLEQHPFGAPGANDAAFARLAQAGVDVAWSSDRFALTHTKLIVVDGARAAVMTANLTHAGLTTNREYIAFDDDPDDVAAAGSVIAADRASAGAAPAARGRLVTSPETARAALLPLMAGAERQLRVEMEELSDAGAVATLVAAAARGVAVTVVAPATDRAPATSAALGRLVDAGVRVRALSAPAVHAKAIVADGRRLYVGSINLTAASLDRNREVGVIVEDAGAAARVERTIDGDAAVGAPP
ncbi:MAG TPA: phospholipase D-like domain-containing protein [Polyangia bacterium]|nr:phospholipase D-like domain-containing protein [Polyangia bacterium]